MSQIDQNDDITEAFESVVVRDPPPGRIAPGNMTVDSISEDRQQSHNAYNAYRIINSRLQAVRRKGIASLIDPFGEHPEHGFAEVPASDAVKVEVFDRCAREKAKGGGGFTVMLFGKPWGSEGWHYPSEGVEISGWRVD